MFDLKEFGGSSGCDCDSPSPLVYGSKGAHLMEMSEAGLPVPEGIVVPVAYSLGYKNGDHDLNGVVEKLCAWAEGVREHEGFALFSVRSGAPVSMPGMMDTILNVGLTKGYRVKALKVLGGVTTRDCYKRLNTMFMDVAGIAPPSTLFEQLRATVKSVFKSWDNERAQAYRKHHGISDSLGTAVVVQRMVFGNLGDTSGSGVCFTRNPSTGEAKMMGEYLPNAQGEDVVAGTSTPNDIHTLGLNLDTAGAYDKLRDIAQSLEKQYKDMQDVEFTVEDGNLYILQTRTGKRTAKAAVTIAVDMEKEGLITREEALSRITGKQFLLSSRPIVDPTYTYPPTFIGLPACNGVIAGVVGEDILVAKETTPNDLSAMIASRGIITETGGVTSHAAVVARSLDKPCITGVPNLMGMVTLGHGVVMDGSTGHVWVGVQVPIINGADSSCTNTVTTWALEELGAFRLTSELRTPYTVVAVADWVLDGTWEAKLEQFGKSVKEIGVENVILDLSPPSRYLLTADDLLLGLLGPGEKDRIQTSYLALVTELLRNPIKDLSLLGADCFSAEEVSNAGMSLVRTVSTPDCVLRANEVAGRVVVSEGFVGSCGSPHAAIRVMEAFGENLCVLPQPVTEVSAVLSVLAKEEK